MSPPPFADAGQPDDEPQPPITGAFRHTSPSDEPMWVAPPDEEDDWDADAYHELFEAEAEAAPTGSPEREALSVGADVDLGALGAYRGLAGIGPHGLAQDGPGDGMTAGLLLSVIAEQAVTGCPSFTSGSFSSSPFVAGPARDSLPGAEAAGWSRAAGDGRLAGVPGVPGADGVRALTDDELLGTVSAATRQQNRAEWLELAATAEFARRRFAMAEAAVQQGRGLGQREGEFAAEELRYETLSSARRVEERIDLAVALAARLPCLMARMSEGAIRSYWALVVHRATSELSEADARLVDAALAPDAAGMTAEALGRRARALAMALDPEVAEKRRKRGRKQKRLETWQEDSGNAALAGREMTPEDVLAANAYYDAIATALRRAGVAGSLRELRILAFTDRNTGKDPLDRIPGFTAKGAGAAGGVRDDEADNSPGCVDHPGGNVDGHDFFPEAHEGYRDGGRYPDYVDDPRSSAGSGDPAKERPADAPHDEDIQIGLRDHGYRDDETWPFWEDEERASEAGGQEVPPIGTAVPFPATVNLLVPVGTLLGWSGMPGEASRLGLLDAQSTRSMVQSVSSHPKTRWCVTLIGPDGAAVAHGCAPGRHPWLPPDPATGAPVADGAAVADLIRQLGVNLETVARGTCDHRHLEEHYTPSRKLRHLVQARTMMCPAPGCGAKAVHNDLDHTIPWPDGVTDECNLSPPCRHHHRVKQAPGWKLEQPSPGVMSWTTPSGRVYTTRPTVYDLVE